MWKACYVVSVVEEDTRSKMIDECDMLYVLVRKQLLMPSNLAFIIINTFIFFSFSSTVNFKDFALFQLQNNKFCLHSLIRTFPFLYSFCVQKDGSSIICRILGQVFWVEFLPHVFLFGLSVGGTVPLGFKLSSGPEHMWSICTFSAYHVQGGSRGCAVNKQVSVLAVHCLFGCIIGVCCGKYRRQMLNIIHQRVTWLCLPLEKVRKLYECLINSVLQILA